MQQMRGSFLGSRRYIFPRCCREAEAAASTVDGLPLRQAGTTTPSQAKPFVPAEAESAENLPGISHVKITNNRKKRCGNGRSVKIWRLPS